MRGTGGRYRSLDDLQHEARDIVTPFWKAVSHLSMWLLLGGFLMLPTTFDSDPQLRFSSGVIIVLVCALLAAGYALIALLYYAVPSPIFRLESLLIPAASASFFGMCAAAWTLVSSPRFDPSLPGCPITLALSFASVLLFGSIGAWTSHDIKGITTKKPWPVSGHPWQDSGSAHYNPYTSSTYPLTAPADNNGTYYAHPLQDYPPSMHDHNTISQEFAYPNARSSVGTIPGHTPSGYVTPYIIPSRLVEEDMVGQQMAGLLAKPTPVPSPSAAQETFHLDWPPGGDDLEDNAEMYRPQSQVVTGGVQLLSPSTHARGRSRSGSDSGIPIIRIGTLSKPEDRGRTTSRPRAQRDRSRDERRKEIERNSIS